MIVTLHVCWLVRKHNFALFRLLIPLTIRFELASLRDIAAFVLDSLLLTSVLKYFVSLYLKSICSYDLSPIQL